MRDFLAILTVKIMVKVMNWFGYRAGTLPGRIAIKINPQILKHLKYPKDVIFITGTNGKTSVTNMVCNVLEKHGLKVLGNRLGDNLDWGITTAILLGSSLSGQIKADVVCLEVDELTGVRLIQSITPNYILVNNFFRDQLDRVGEMDTLINLYERIVADYTGCVVLNANDPNVMRIAQVPTRARFKFYGLKPNESIISNQNEAAEGRRCPKCGAVLQYSARFYSHIGVYHCVNHDFMTPNYDIEAKDIDLQQGTFKVNDISYHIMYQMLYSVLNQCAVIALAEEFKVNPTTIKEAFKTFYVNNGRMEKLRLRENRDCLLNLVKNPAGAGEVIKYVAKQPETKAILCILNDNDADGNDVSWIWDTPFDYLVNEKTEAIICSGTRAHDMAIRFKYADISLDKLIIIPDKAEAVLKLQSYDLNSYILSNYTALQATRKELKKIAYEM